MSFLQQLAEAYMAKRRHQLGIGAEERATAASADDSLVKRAQAALAAQRMELAPAEQESEIDLRSAQADQARAHGDYFRNPPSRAGAGGTLKPILDDAGNVVGFYSNKPGASGDVAFFDKTGKPVGAQPPAAATPPVEGTPAAPPPSIPPNFRDRPKPNPPAPPRDRFTFLTNDKGEITGVGNTSKGTVGAVGGTPAAPGAPATVGGEVVRKSSSPAAILSLGMARQRAAPVLQDLGSRILAINKGSEGGLLARGAGVLKSAAGSVGANPAADLYHTGVRGFTPLLARSVGHTGVLTEQDVQRTELLFPRIGDAEKVSREKLARLQRIMSGAEPLPFQWDQPSYDEAGNTQAAPEAGGGAQTRVINGVTYVKVPGGWQKQ